MGSKRRRVFTPEYRREAARLVIDTGRTAAAVAGELGLVEQTLCRWVALERAALAQDVASGLSRPEREELERLRKENAELRLDNEFLGKAAAFFAASPPRRSATR